MRLQNDTYVDKARNVIEGLGDSITRITTTQIRNILAMTSDIYNDVLLEKDEKLSQDIIDRIYYLKVRMVYEYGRGRREVQEFIKKAQLLECIDEINGKRSQFMLFSRYMEALVAYHRYYGGKD